MRKCLLAGLCTVALILGSATASRAAQVVLNFDELTGDGAMPDPYMGIIDWEDGVWFYYDSFQDPYTPHSGATRTFQDTFDTTPSWEFLSPVVFDGAWWSGQEFASAQYNLYDAGNVLVHTSATIFGSSVPQFLASGYSGLVKRVEVLTPEADYILMDDLTYSTEDATVPEPATLGLLGLGLAALGRRARRTRQ